MLKNRIFLSAAMALFLCLFALPAFGAGNPAEVKLSFDQNAFGADEGVLVKVSISNPNKGSLKILRWFTPVDGVSDDLFQVSIDGNPVEYIGRHYKRQAPTDNDYITLKGGETVEAIIDLAGFYDLSRSGFYEVSYRALSYNLFSKESGFTDEDSLTSAAEMLWIEGRETKVPESPVDSVIGSTSFSGCTTSRQADLNTARNNAFVYSTNSTSYLNAGTVNSRYTTWFGSYTSSRYTTVRNHFTSIDDAMNNAAVTFNCSCTSSAYAYVYSNQPYTIYLCNAFWTAPAQGTDSKAGTLIHEMSHFTVVAGTSDYAYGHTAAKKLAAKTPNKAINNADNHEYFAENTPALP